MLPRQATTPIRIIGPAEAPTPVQRPNPYPGLRPFEFEDAEYFFGREAHIDELLARLGQRRFVAVVGPSGCGKSSLTRAGLIPALLDGMLGDTGMNWARAIMRPGNKPEEELKECLLPLLPGPTMSNEGAESNVEREAFDAPRFYVERAFDGSRDALARAAAQIVMSSSANNLLVLVDQFEELFRFNRRPGDEKEWYERSDRFVQQLLAAVQDPAGELRGKVYVVLTMRDEFVGRCAIFPGLAEAMNAGMYLVPRLTRKQLADAVRLPAKCAGRSVSQGLAERVVNDSIAVQDELPVLQHAMMRTWLALSPDAVEIGLDDYLGAGSVESALDRHGEELMGELLKRPAGETPDTGRLRICEKVFKRLTLDTGEESTRSPASVAELAAVAEVAAQDSDLLQILELFRSPACQFLAPSPNVEKHLLPDTEIDLTHEAILRTWQRLKHWAADERGDAVTYRRLLDSALQYEKDPQTTSLLREPQLSPLLEWWVAHHPTGAWAARYHPEPKYLQNEGFARYTEQRGESASPRHEALCDATRKFLEASREQRDLAIAEEAEQARVESSRQQRELRQRLLNYILVPALVILAVASSLWVYVAQRATRLAEQESRFAKEELIAKAKVSEAAARAAEAQVELARQEALTNKQLAASSRREAEASKKEAAAAREALEAQAALGVAQKELEAKVKQLEVARQKAADEAKAARREADAAATELGKLAPIRERNREIQAELDRTRAELERLRRQPPQLQLKQ